MPSSTSYKLTYFDLRYLGEGSRQVLIYAGQKFEDNRINRELWESQLKSKSKYGKLPILEVDGKHTLYESAAISRLLARRHGLTGADEFKAALADEIVDHHRDVMTAFSGWLFVKVGLKPGDEAQVYKEIAQPTADAQFPVYVKLLKTSGTGYLVGKKVTWADLWVADYLTTLIRHGSKLFDKYPELVQFVDRIHSLPQLKDHIKNRPDNAA
uniref:GST class-sigma n=1 Tax=Dendroctonus armandi TaxID=77159 RepID=A0A5P9JQJ9_9CUCU|nr:glutathione S-transferase GSTs5 [Dendroctonus armandi]